MAKKSRAGKMISLLLAAAVLSTGVGMTARAAGGKQMFLLPDSAIRNYTAEEISEMTPQILCFARNEIYARHGRQFLSQELQQYFELMQWYEGTVPGDAFDPAVLNEYERNNIVLLADAEAALVEGGYTLDQPEYSILEATDYLVDHLPKDEEVVDTYLRFMRENSSLFTEQSESFWYVLYDIDENGTDELMVLYPSGVRSAVQLFTCSDGTVTNILPVDEYGEQAQHGFINLLQRPSDMKICIASSGGAAYYYETIFHMENGALVRDAMLLHDYSTESFTRDDQPITEEEYNLLTEGFRNMVLGMKEIRMDQVG